MGLLDKFLKIAGRDTNGVARPVKTDAEGNLNVVIKGSYVANALVTGVKKVTATVGEIYAGDSPKSQRRQLIIKNEDAILRLRVGANKANLQQQGFPIEPGASMVFQFEPGTTVPIYAVSEGAAIKVAVMEV